MKSVDEQYKMVNIFWYVKQEFICWEIFVYSLLCYSIWHFIWKCCVLWWIWIWRIDKFCLFPWRSVPTSVILDNCGIQGFYLSRSETKYWEKRSQATSTTPGHKRQVKMLFLTSAEEMVRTGYPPEKKGLYFQKVGVCSLREPAVISQGR